MESAIEHLNRARRVLPGGVSASARANPAIGHPFYISRGDGARVHDLDGNEYIDMCCSHGASLLGHNHPGIVSAIRRALELGVICSYETVHHVELAERLAEMVPCAEMVRFAGSGTETVMHAVRLARAATGRQKILKFEGHFHGYSDSVFHSSGTPLDQAGPADHPVTFPQSAGMPDCLKELVVVVPFNDPAALHSAFEEHGTSLAMLIMEPINYDQGCIPPRPGFLQLCRELCYEFNALLLFDEVLTAFRVAAGGAQEYSNVTPDLAVLGKALGGGTPISAIVGTRKVMRNLRPVGDCEHSGTYLAHLTTVLGALAALDEYRRPDFYQRLDAVGKRFYAGLDEIVAASSVPLRVQHLGPRFGLYFGITDEVTNYRQAALQNVRMEYAFVRGCVERGVYMAVSPHHGFSAAHTEDDMDQVLVAMAGALGDVNAAFG